MARPNCHRRAVLRSLYKSSSLKPGRYSLQMTLENETHYGSFYIEQYKKPETRAAFSVEKPVLLSGENAEAILFQHRIIQANRSRSRRLKL